MSTNLPNFEQAEYVDVPSAEAVSIEPENGAFVWAIAGGIAGALIGAVVYAAFIIATGISIGYLAIGVGYLVAKGMNLGSDNSGGLKYQVTSVVLTYFSVAAGYSGMAWWLLRARGDDAFSMDKVIALAGYGLSHPLTRVIQNPAGGVIGLFILFVGMRAAWRMTSGIPGEMNHPFRR